MTFQNFQLNFSINEKVDGRGQGRVRVLESVQLLRDGPGPERVENLVPVLKWAKYTLG